MEAMILKPIISEKSMRLAATRQYIFNVPINANKIEIAREAHKLFKVDVVNVRTSILKGKTKRFRALTGKRKDVKKAIITVKAGQSIKIFEAEETKTDKKRGKQ